MPTLKVGMPSPAGLKLRQSRRIAASDIARCGPPHFSRENT